MPRIEAPSKKTADGDNGDKVRPGRRDHTHQVPDTERPGCVAVVGAHDLSAPDIHIYIYKQRVGRSLFLLGVPSVAIHSFRANAMLTLEGTVYKYKAARDVCCKSRQKASNVWWAHSSPSTG